MSINVADDVKQLFSLFFQTGRHCVVTWNDVQRGRISTARLRHSRHPGLFSFDKIFTDINVMIITGGRGGGGASSSKRVWILDGRMCLIFKWCLVFDWCAAVLFSFWMVQKKAASLDHFIYIDGSRAVCRIGLNYRTIELREGSTYKFDLCLMLLKLCS